MSYEIINRLSDAHKDQLHELYKNEWWSKNRSRQDVDTILTGSSFVLGIVHKENNALVGFTRVLTDDFKYAYIYDVIVSPLHRGQRLGHILLESVINHPRLQNVKNIELTCADSMTKFYEKYGFTMDYGSTIPMKRCNPTATRN